MLVQQFIQTGKRVTQYNVQMGSALYMAPEQILIDNNSIGPASDIYSLGIILYEMLSQRNPFAAGSETEIKDKHLKYVPPPPGRLQGRAKYSSSLDRVIMRCLQKKVADRYQSVEALYEDLKQMLKLAETLREGFKKLLKDIDYPILSRPVKE